MSDKPIRVLLVEDEASDAYLVRMSLRQAQSASFDVTWVDSLAIAQQQLSDDCFDVVLLDLSLPDSEGLATIKKVRLVAGEIPIVILTGRNDTDFSLTALEAGATDYIIKGDFGFDGLARIIRYALLRVEMEAHNRLLVAALNAAANGIIITDKDAVIKWANPAFSRLTGFSLDEAIGHKPNELIQSGAQDTEFYHEMWGQLLAGNHWRGEIINKRKDGSLYHEELSIASVKNSRGDITHFIGIKEDISERKNLEETVKQLAFYDPLTQLPNRRLLDERLKHGIETSRRIGNKMAVLMLDLDKFKAVNDTLGHAAGDELLQQAAVRIKACLREVDTVARLGGDEFVVLMEDIEHPEHVARVANEIINTLKTPFKLIEKQFVTIGVSIGIAIYPSDGDNVEALLDNADTALYRAKDQGRGCFAYFFKAIM